MRHLGDNGQSLTGMLLIAHPGLKDPNFRKSIILVSAHSMQDGAMGVIINNATGQTLGELKPELASGPLANTPIFVGGPVGSGEVILTAWKKNDHEELRLYFGVSVEKAEELLDEDPEIHLRGFLGYSGWAEGQLEDELSESAWVLSPLLGGLLSENPGERMWLDILLKISPELAFLARMPDDPSNN